MECYAIDKSRSAKLARRTEGKEVIVGRVACDFVSITTYSKELYEQWRELVRTMYLGVPTGTAFAQYSGISYDDSVKLVEGTQNGQPHYMVSVSGANADVFLHYYIEEGAIPENAGNCTRLDIQLTLPKLEDRPRLATLAMDYQEGRLGEFLGRGRPKVYSYAGDDGDTLYIGSGQSEKLVRVYDKEVTDRKGKRTVAERAELQLRASRAQSIFERMLERRPHYSEGPMRAALKAELEKLPKLMAQQIAACQKGAIDGKAEAAIYQRRGGGPRTKWLNTNSNAMVEACNQSGPDGDICKMIILDVLARSLTGKHTGSVRGWTITSPEGRVYKVADVSYTDSVESALERLYPSNGDAT